MHMLVHKQINIMQGSWAPDLNSTPLHNAAAVVNCWFRYTLARNVLLAAVLCCS